MYTQTELYHFKANISTKCNYRKVCGGVCVQSQERERENERGRLRDTTVLRLGKIKITKMKILNPTATLPYLTLLSTHTHTHTHTHTDTHRVWQSNPHIPQAHLPLPVTSHGEPLIF